MSEPFFPLPAGGAQNQPPSSEMTFRKLDVLPITLI
jgi:hypothetical protein